MPQWTGEELKRKSAMAVDLFKQAITDLSNHEDWIHLTEVVWQKLSDAIVTLQLDILRHERFSSRNQQSIDEVGRLAQYEKYRRAIKALNFLFKCYDVDWDAFRQTVVDLVEGNHGDGHDCSARRNQPTDSETTDGKGSDDSGAG